MDNLLALLFNDIVYCKRKLALYLFYLFEDNFENIILNKL